MFKSVGESASASDLSTNNGVSGNSSKATPSYNFFASAFTSRSWKVILFLKSILFFEPE